MKYFCRNRDVEETLSKTADFGCNEKYDKLELRNRFTPRRPKTQKKEICKNTDNYSFRTVTETLSLKDDLGQDAEKPEKNGTNGDAKEFDTLELRNR